MLKAKECETFPARLRDALILGDCVEGMRAIPDATVDFILTDPPYVARFRDRSGRTLINDDNDRWLKPAFAEAFRILRPNRFLVCFYGWPKVDRFLDAWHSAGFRPLGHFVAVKRYTSSKRGTCAISMKWPTCWGKARRRSPMNPSRTFCLGSTPAIAGTPPRSRSRR